MQRFALLLGMMVAVAASLTEWKYTSEMKRTLSPNAYAEHAAGMSRSTASEGSSQDCAMRRLALQYANTLHPAHSPHSQLFDALRLAELCGDLRPIESHTPHRSQQLPTPPSDRAIYVAPTGDDTNDGSVDAPLASVGRALAAARAGYGPPDPVIVLREGLHFLNETVTLSAVDSGITIQSHPNEHGVLSGGRKVPASVQWTKLNRSGSVWRAVLPVGFGPVEALYALLPDRSTQPMTRARHPNKNPADGSMDHALWNPPNMSWIKQHPWASPARTVWMATPNDTEHHAGVCGTHFTYGVGGPCDRYEPQGGYLCSENATGGGYGWEEMVPGAPLFPVGLRVPTEAFSKAKIPPPSQWQVTGAIPVLMTWTNGWATTFWQVENVSESASDELLSFGRGGQQIGRGFHDPGNDPKAPMYDAGPWMIENALELLDAPEEFFFDPTTRQLTLWYNASGSPSDVEWLVPQLKQLVQVKGTQGAPVEDVTLLGIGLSHTMPTYLDDWGVPSGGDWALHRGGACFVEGATGFKADLCTFAHLGGNALFLSGFTRNAQILNSSFSDLGESAVAAWGYTRDLASTDTKSRLPAGVGIDGSAGEQPRGTKFIGNVVHDIGLKERQSSAFGEFKACESVVQNNIVYNIPRAAVNINDGFGGGTVIRSNLLFNTCRESGDHGPFNSWDRQPFIHDSTGSLTPKFNTIDRNFLFSNYGSGFGVDNDDTSSYYNITSNVFYGGGGVKCDYDGHDKFFSRNVMVGQEGGAACHHTCAYKQNYTDHCFDNTIVQATKKSGGPLNQMTDPFAIIWFCNAEDPSKIMHDYSNEMLPVIHSNRIFNADGKNANITCGYSGPSNKTLVPLQRFLDAGLMQNTTVGLIPSDLQLVDWCRDVLGI